MKIEYRRLTEKDLETFIEIRIGQLREEGAKEDFDLRPNLMDYYKRHMADGTFVSWLAVDSDADGKIIGTSGIRKIPIRAAIIEIGFSAARTPIFRPMAMK